MVRRITVTCWQRQASILYKQNELVECSKTNIILALVMFKVRGKSLHNMLRESVGMFFFAMNACSSDVLAQLESISEMVLFACAFLCANSSMCVSLSMCLCCVQIGFFDVSNTKQTSTTFFFVVDKILAQVTVCLYLLTKFEIDLELRIELSIRLRICNAMLYRHYGN